MSSKESSHDVKAPIGVGELANMYRPHVEPSSARRWLWRAVRCTPGLTDELKRLGYRKHQKLLTPAQVEAIIRGLGGP